MLKSTKSSIYIIEMTLVLVNIRNLFLMPIIKSVEAQSRLLQNEN
jgi:hypothetical protein